MILNFTAAKRFYEEALSKVRPAYIALECQKVTNILIQLAAGNENVIPERVCLPKYLSDLGICETYHHLFEIPIYRIKFEESKDPRFKVCKVISSK